MQESIDHLEQEFYDNKFYFSYSSISKLLYSPAVFYQIYILGHKEERTEKHLIEGSIIHCLLLDEQNFDNQFIVSPANLPKDKLKQLVDTVYYKNQSHLSLDSSLDFDQFEQTILDTMAELNYFQALKTDQQRIDKVVTAETKSYWNFLKKKGDKDLIDEDTLKYCKDSVEIIKMTPDIMNLLGMNGGNIEVFNELYFQSDLKNLPFGLKGILDNLVIDHDKKIIFINDFKTSSKSLKEFPETVEYYNYWMQALIYMMIISEKYMHLLDQGYDIRFHFIVIDRFFNVYAFPVSAQTRIQWLTRFNNTLEIVKYHYENKRYELPHEFDTGSVIL